jgi:hypothetical protein
MKTWVLFLITIGCLMILIGSFALGRYSKNCPPQTIVRIDTSIVINQPEIDRLSRWLNEQIKQNDYLQFEIDSLTKLLNKKYETKVIYIDTVNVPAIFREWAKYNSQ